MIIFFLLCLFVGLYMPWREEVSRLESVGWPYTN
jgi:hypothetical protein